MTITRNNMQQQIEKSGKKTKNRNPRKARRYNSNKS